MTILRVGDILDFRKNAEFQQPQHSTVAWHHRSKCRENILNGGKDV